MAPFMGRVHVDGVSLKLHAAAALTRSSRQPKSNALAADFFDSIDPFRSSSAGTGSIDACSGAHEWACQIDRTMPTPFLDTIRSVPFMRGPTQCDRPKVCLLEGCLCGHRCSLSFTP